jgi:hypothetical protein
MAGVLFAAAEPGSANVLARFLSECGQGSGPCAIWAHEAAAQPFAGAGHAPVILAGPTDEADLGRRWREHQPGALITGTSLEGRLEPALWRLAARDGVRSLAWIDQWTNLARRFARGRPGWVAVIDERQREELTALGFSPSRMLIGGQPHLFALGTAVELPGAEAAGRGVLRVLFASEPYAADIAAGRLDDPGFDELAVFDLVLAAAERARVLRPDQAIELVVKFHPLEGAAARFLARLRAVEPSAGLSLRWLGGERSGLDALGEADLVIGMSSTLLLEAMRRGKPVLSLQPGLRGEDPFAPSGRQAALYAHEAGEALELATRALSDPATRHAALERQRRFFDSLPRGGCAAVARWLEAGVSPAHEESGHELR